MKVDDKMQASKLLKHILKQERLNCSIRHNKKQNQNQTDYENKQINLIPSTFHGTDAEAYRVVAHEAGHVYNNTHSPQHYKMFNWLRYWIFRLSMISVVVGISHFLLFVFGLLKYQSPIDHMITIVGILMTIVSLIMNYKFIFIVYEDEKSADKFGKILAENYYKYPNINPKVTINDILDSFQKNEQKFLKHPYVLTIIGLSFIMILIQFLYKLAI
ncbi:zinc metallopeptidase [Bacillus tropicus]|uniref:zinc metallopeptidase n=1 Tax=Bacillus tropicus TaxID=2026188 RepID=UPI0021D18595|nr:zinc metallopeptidase [Bacillus tropicus]MCU5002920.1 zinc metallopeptidase [Bacillus tropicus]